MKKFLENTRIDVKEWKNTSIANIIVVVCGGRVAVFKLLLSFSLFVDGKVLKTGKCFLCLQLLYYIMLCINSLDGEFNS